MGEKELKEGLASNHITELGIGAAMDILERDGYLPEKLSGKLFESVKELTAAVDKWHAAFRAKSEEEKNAGARDAVLLFFFKKYLDSVRVSVN